MCHGGNKTSHSMSHLLLNSPSKINLSLPRQLNSMSENFETFVITLLLLHLEGSKDKLRTSKLYVYETQKTRQISIKVSLDF